jgi:hypothetical protein
VPRDGPFVIHDEAGNRATEAFFAEFLPAVRKVMAQHLGTEPPWPLHVVLSDHRTHAGRFPPAADELLELLDPSEAAEVSTNSLGLEAARRRYESASYAHGAVTRVDARHGAPSAAPVGDLAMYLDVESIAALATEMDVLPEGLLGRVATHELSHVFRGHADGPGTATHGWLAEGDAQRDAWEVLTELLRDSDWAPVARWGRIAQARLAARQPPAYRQFDLGGAERAGLRHDEVIDPPGRWVVHPPRKVFRLVREGAVEIPVSAVLQSPAIADQVYLRDHDMVAGPWVVVARCEAARLGHPKDRDAVERYIADYPSGAGGRITWLQLRPVEPLAAGDATDAVPSPYRLHAEIIESEGEIAKLLTSEAREKALGLAEANAMDWRMSFDEMNVWLREAGRPPVPLPEYDPFDDWG